VALEKQNNADKEFRGVSVTERKADLEKVIKRLLIRQHQEVFGKGHDEVWVKANRNLLTFYCGGVLTALEEFFLKSPGGEK